MQHYAARILPVNLLSIRGARSHGLHAHPGFRSSQTFVTSLPSHRGLCTDKWTTNIHTRQSQYSLVALSSVRRATTDGNVAPSDVLRPSLQAGCDGGLVFRSRAIDAWKQRNFVQHRWKSTRSEAPERGYDGSSGKSHGSTVTPPNYRISKDQDASKKEEVAGSGAKRESSLREGITSTVTQRHLMDRLPHMTQIQRPGKEELLAAANGFWSRLKVRFKWFSIRSVRPFNADEIGAFFSWVLVGHVLWIFLGTTTFFSLAILAVNTVFAQGM